VRRPRKSDNALAGEGNMPCKARSDGGHYPHYVAADMRRL
jgi:hypothetical protein